MRASLRRWTTLALATLGLALGSLQTIACASILDIKDLPLGEPDGAVPSPDAPTNPEDAGPEACAPRGTRFCEQLCPVPDFCDDFEGPTLAAGWDPLIGLTNPLRSTPASNVTLVRDDGGTNQVALAEAKSVLDDADTALLITTLDKATRGRKLRGVRVVLEARPTALHFDLPDGGKAGEMSFLAFGGQTFNEGVGVMLLDDGGTELSIGLQQRRLGGGGSKFMLVPSVLDGPRAAFFSNTFAIDLYVGKPDLLRELKIGCNEVVDAGEDAGGPDTVRVVLLLSKQNAKCAAFKNELASGDWLSSTALFAGASVSDYGTTSVRLDNLAVYLFE